MPDTHLHPPAASGEGNDGVGIEQQIPQHLSQLIRIAASDDVDVGVCDDFDAHGLQAVARGLHQLVQQHFRMHPNGPRGRGSGIGQELLHEMGEALRFALHDPQHAAAFFVEPRSVGTQQLQTANHGGQGVSHLVSKPGGQAPQLGESLGPTHFPLQPPQFGQILKDDDVADSSDPNERSHAAADETCAATADVELKLEAIVRSSDELCDER